MPTDLNNQFVNNQNQTGMQNQNFQGVMQNMPQPFNGYAQNPYAPNYQPMPYYQAPQQGLLPSIAGATPQTGLLRGVLIGAALTYVLTRPNVKKAILDTLGVPNCEAASEDDILG